MFLCEINEIFKNTHFEEQLRMTAFEQCLKQKHWFTSRSHKLYFRPQILYANEMSKIHYNLSDLKINITFLGFNFLVNF